MVNSSLRVCISSMPLKFTSSYAHLPWYLIKGSFVMATTASGGLFWQMIYSQPRGPPGLGRSYLSPSTWVSVPGVPPPQHALRTGQGKGGIQIL